MDLEFESSYPTPVSNSSLLPWLLLSLAIQKHTPDTSNLIKDEYDFIIVGGGAAGSVVASRLTEDPCVTVLLLEAGHKPPRLTDVPGLGMNFAGTDVDWQFKTVRQKHAARGVINEQISLPAGKMIGGSSNHNEMAYIRGNRKDYDGWENMGAKGWSFKDVLPYFLKLEDNRSLAKLANGYHAVGGPITVEDSVYYPEIKRALNKAAELLGYEFVDTNAARQTGFYSMQRNVRDQQRCSTAKAYLVPAENRPNLDIFLNATATKVIIKNRKATGVKFYHDGQFRIVKARKEVVMSAGSINTPKILMLSGVGPREQLQKFHIPVISDLPVGKNFHDHPISYIFATQRPGAETVDQKYSNPENILQYIYSRSGPLTELFQMQAFLNDDNVTCNIDSPNYGILAFEVPEMYANGLRLKPKIQDRFKILYEEKALVGCIPHALRPKSRGTLTLSSSNPFIPPLIDPNYLDHPDDVQALADGFKVCMELFTAEPVSKLGIRPITTPMPGCERYLGCEDEYYSCYAKSLTFTYFHYVGTCKMGDPEDPTTVVDPELRVKKVRGLRVVDASIMPVIPTGNTHIPTVMIAEKASDMIKEANRRSSRKSHCHEDTF